MISRRTYYLNAQSCQRSYPSAITLHIDNMPAGDLKTTLDGTVNVDSRSSVDPAPSHDVT